MSPTTHIERTFKDVPRGRIAEAEDRDLLLSLGFRKAAVWENLLKSRRVLIIAEAGSGKTYECQNQCDRLKADGIPAFFLELAALAQDGVRELLSPEDEDGLDLWLSASHGEATFFIDSIDELQLTAGSLDRALRKLAKVIHGHLHRVRIVITTRPVAFDEQTLRKHLPAPDTDAMGYDEESFADMAMGDTVRRESQKSNNSDDIPIWRVVGLMPLTNEQIVSFAAQEAISHPNALLEDLISRGALPLAQQPQDLIQLCADWEDHKRIRSYREQLAASIRNKLVARPERAELVALSPERSLSGAKRLALASVLTRRLTLRHSAAADDLTESHALDPAQILTDWTAEDIRTLLERPLFGFASYGRVRFHHRSVTEYLAAQQLSDYLDDGMSTAAFNRLLFDGRRRFPVLRASLRPVAAWLAGTLPATFSQLRDYAPSALLDEADPQSLSVTQRQQCLQSYVRTYGAGGWRGLSVKTLQAHRFVCKELAPDITRLWNEGIENPDVRELLLELIEAGRLTPCAPIAREAIFAVGERRTENIEALRALIALDDESLPAFCQALADGELEWPDSLARHALPLIFPDHLSVGQLLTYLERLQPGADEAFDELRWSLPHRMADSGLNLAALAQLRDGLVALLSEGMEWNLDHMAPLRSPYAVLARTLAATCLEGLKYEADEAWLSASVLAVRLRDRSGLREDAIGTLHARLSSLDANATERLFWIDCALLARWRTPKDVWRSMWDIVRGGGPVTLDASRDEAWILETLANNSLTNQKRELALEVALYFLPFDTSESHQAKLLELCEGAPELIARITEWAIPSEHAERYRKDEEKREKRKAKAKRKRDKARDSWVKFHQEIRGGLDAFLVPEKRLQTLWDLGRVMGYTQTSGRNIAWNYHYLISHFGSVAADQLRDAFAGCWTRIDPPVTLPSEREPGKRSSEYNTWSLGLAGLYAAAETPGWAEQLSPDDAKLAARYVPLVLNGFPEWMEDLIAAHPDAVEATLGEELSLELAGIKGENGYSPLLSTLAYAEGGVSSLFRERILTALEAASLDPSAPLLCGDTAYKAAKVIRDNSTPDALSRLHTLTCEVLCHDLAEADRLNWLYTLFVLDPEDASQRLHSALADIEPMKASKATRWLSHFFGDHGHPVDLSDARLSIDQRMALLELAYQHVRIQDDNRRGSGSYTPDARDNAERARSALLSSILDLTGDAGLKAKLALAKSPYCAHFKDRIVALAEERWALDVDAVCHTPQQIVALHETHATQITSTASMHAVCLDRLDRVEDLLLSDVSPRATWCQINDEHMMRREIARVIDYEARGLYTVDQEGVTADEKETDIRLRSVLTEHQSVIELKLAGHYSPNQLLDAIDAQLSTLYLAPAERQSGVFLLTYRGARGWRHPETNKPLAFSDLIGLLRDKAKRLQDISGGQRQIDVVGLDLRPRLDKSGKIQKETIVIGPAEAGSHNLGFDD